MFQELFKHYHKKPSNMKIKLSTVKQSLKTNMTMS